MFIHSDLKPYAREIRIISAILFFKIGLVMAYRAAERLGLDISNF